MNQAKQASLIWSAPDAQQEQMPYDSGKSAKEQEWTEENIRSLLESCKLISLFRRGTVRNMAQELLQQDRWRQSTKSSINGRLRALGVKAGFSNDDFNKLLESLSSLKSKQSTYGGRIVSTTLNPIPQMILPKEERGDQLEECELTTLSHRDLQAMKDWCQEDKDRSQKQRYWLQQERNILEKGGPSSSYALNRPIVSSLTSRQQCPSSFAYQNAEAVFKFHDDMLPAVRKYICDMWQLVPENINNLSERLDQFCKITPYKKESMIRLLTDRALAYQKNLETRV